MVTVKFRHVLQQDFIQSRPTWTIQDRKMHYGLGTASQHLWTPAWFHPFAAKSWARRHALWPDSKIVMRKHSSCERILRICNLLPNLVLNLSALICHALKSRMVIQMWPCTWVQVAICATCAMSNTLLACFSLLDILWATPAGSVISYNIISANISKLSGTENHVLFQ